MGSSRRTYPKNEKNATSNVASQEPHDEIGELEPIVRCYAIQNIITESHEFNEEANCFVVSFPIIHTAVTVENV